MKKNILIYSDKGVSPACVKETVRSLRRALDSKLINIKLAKGDFMKKSSWEKETALFVMPGGRSSPYYKQLSDAGNQKIVDYVKSGGNYLGICAGGYYGCQYTEFAKGYEELEICCDGALNFFPNSAVGPVYGAEEFEYSSQKGARAVPIIWLEDQSIHTVYYNGGCYFTNAEKYKNTKILATLADMKNNPATIIECQVEKGKAILMGIHLEYSYQALKPEEQKNKSFYQTLKINEEKRQQLFETLLLRYSIAAKLDG